LPSLKEKRLWKKHNYTERPAYVLNIGRDVLHAVLELEKGKDKDGKKKKNKINKIRF
jgi:hypothetical protein